MNLILLSNLNVPRTDVTQIIERVLSAGTEVCVSSDAYHDSQSFVWLSVRDCPVAVKCPKAQLKPAYLDL